MITEIVVILDYRRALITEYSDDRALPISMISFCQCFVFGLAILSDRAAAILFYKRCTRGLRLSVANE